MQTLLFLKILYIFLKKVRHGSQARSQARMSGKSQQMCLAAPSAENPR